MSCFYIQQRHVGETQTRGMIRERISSSRQVVNLNFISQHDASRLARTNICRESSEIQGPCLSFGELQSCEWAEMLTDSPHQQVSRLDSASPGCKMLTAHLSPDLLPGGVNARCLPGGFAADMSLVWHSLSLRASFFLSWLSLTLASPTPTPLQPDTGADTPIAPRH